MTKINKFCALAVSAAKWLYNAFCIKICPLIVSVVMWLYNTFKGSILYKALLATVVTVAEGYSTSTLKKVLTGKGDLERSSESSLFYRVLGGIVKLAIRIFSKIIDVVLKLLEGSKVKQLYGMVVKKPFDEAYIYLISFVTVVIFVIPHSFWSNTFGLLFAVLLFAMFVKKVSSKGANAIAALNVGKLWFSFLFFGFCLVFSCFVSYNIADSIRVLMFFITSFVLCFVVYASITDKNSLDVVCGFMYAALAITSVLAIIQRLLGVEADAALTDMNLNAGMPGRVFATMGNPNNYAEFLVLFMPFAFAFVLNRPKGKQRDRLLYGMLLSVVAILLTYSRSGWIALAIAVAIFVAMYDKTLIPIFIGAAILAIPFIPKNVLNRILTIGNLQDSSSSYRVDIWTGCLRMLKEYWVTGVGLGTGGFAEIYPDYAVGASGVAPHSHMQFMEMLCELGIIGFISYLCMTVTLIKRSFIAASRSVPAEIRNVAIASAASMTGIITIGCFEYCWFYPRVMFAFFVCAGVAMAAYKLAKQAKNDNK